MVYIFIILFVLCSLFYFKHYIATKDNHLPLEDVVDKEVQKSLKPNKAANVMIGILKEDRSFFKSYGPDDADEKTIFQLGSVTKVFNTLLLQVLCDEKVVRLEQTLEELIGDIPLSAEAKKVTLKQLATHTAGFPKVPKVLLEYVVEKVGKSSVMVDPYSHIDVDTIFAYLAHTDENHKVGKFVYSNYGMGLLGHVLERVTGQTYEHLLQEKILTPLNMTNTGISLTPVMQDNLIQGYTAKGEPTPIWTFNALAGAGALNANAEDMLKFIKATVNEQSVLFDAFNVTKEPQFHGETGLGWMQPGFFDKFYGNKDIVWHSGMVGGYAAYLSIDTQANTGLIVLVNKAVDPTMLGIMLSTKIRTQDWASTNTGDIQSLK